MKTRFTREQVLSARAYWQNLTPLDLLLFWRHYTVGKGAGSYSAVDASTSFADYLVLSAEQSSYERYHDI